MATSPKKRTGEHRTRSRPRRSGGGWSGAIFMGLLLGAIGVAVIIGPRVYRQFVQDQQPSPSGRSTTPDFRPEPRETEPAPVVERSTPESSGITRTAPEVTAPAVTEPSDEFDKLVAEGKAHFRDGDYEAAAEFYAKAASKPAPPEKIALVQSIAKANEVFAKITRGIEPSVAADASGMHIIKLKSGGKLQAKVIGESGGNVDYVKDNGLSGSFPRSMIASMTPVSQEDVDRQMRDDLVTQKNTMDQEDSLSWYLLAVQALKYNFKDDASEYLKKAWTMDAQLDNTVREYYARKLFKQGAWFHSLGMPKRAEARFDKLFATYPDTDAAKLAREILAEAERERMLAEAARRREAEEEAERKRRLEAERAAAREAAKRREVEVVEDVPEEKVDIPRGGGVTGKDQANIDAGNKKFDEGMALVQEGLSASSAKKQNKCYKKAQQIFQDAVDHYEKALKSDPGNKGLEEQLQKAGMQLYWSKKMCRLQ